MFDHNSIALCWLNIAWVMVHFDNTTHTWHSLGNGCIGCELIPSGTDNTKIHFSWSPYGRHHTIIIQNDFIAGELKISSDKCSCAADGPARMQFGGNGFKLWKKNAIYSFRIYYTAKSYMTENWHASGKLNMSVPPCYCPIIIKLDYKEMPLKSWISDEQSRVVLWP